MTVEILLTKRELNNEVKPMAEHRLLKQEGVTGQAKPITNLLHDTDFEELNGDSTLDQIECALRRVPPKLKGADKLKRLNVREVVIKKLKKMGVNAPAKLVDAAFEPERKKDDASPEANGLNLSKTQPWAKSVEGAVLLDELTATFKRFLVLPEGSAETFALWVLHTHCFEAAHYTPYLNIGSPVKGLWKDDHVGNSWKLSRQTPILVQHHGSSRFSHN